MPTGNPMINRTYLAGEMIDRLGHDFNRRGYIVLDRFFERDLLGEITAEFELMREEKKRFDYYCESDCSYRKLSTINGRIIHERSPFLRGLYHDAGLRDWIRRVTHVDLMDCSESLWAIFNIHEGGSCDHGWHVDKEAVVLNLMIEENVHEARRGGGLRLFSEWIQLKARYPGASKAELYEMIEQESLFTEVYLEPGQAVVFKGTSVLHKVTSMPRDDCRRVTFLFSWDDEVSSKIPESEASLVLYNQAASTAEHPGQ